MADIVNLLAAAAGAQGEAVETDPNFNQTVLLLHGDGTDGAQNNTFLDSSTNNFTITRAGNTTQGTFSPFSAPDGRWSNYFDGTSGYLIASGGSSNAYDFGTGDATIEAFIYTSDTVGVIASNYASGSSTVTNAWRLIMGQSVSGRLEWSQGATIVASHPTLINDNDWHHVCAVISSGNVTLYVDGVAGTSVSLSGYNYTATTNCYIGAYYTGSAVTTLFQGQIANLRIIKGTAITPPSGGPTSPLTAISGTSLLTCQSNRFVDNSSNAFAITAAGNVKVTPFSPFAPTAAYSPSVNGGSGYFDGADDTLSLSNDTALSPESGDFTVEAWFYPTAALDTYEPIWTGSGTNTIFFGKVTNGYGLRLGGVADLISTPAPEINQWVHIAVSREGTNLRVFLDGELKNTVTNSSTFTTASASYAIGTTTNDLEGYVSDVRFVKGTAVYTASFTRPTAPLTAISGTEFLCNFTNAGIYNNALSGGVNLETVGNAQIDTTTKKFGTGSMEFDGSGDTLLIGTQPDWTFLHNGSSFTIEMWFYTGSTTNQYLASTTATTANRGFRFSMNNTSTRNIEFVFYRDVSGSNLTAISAGSVWNLNTWHHAAAVYDSSTTTLTVYIDGSSVATADASSFAFNQNDPENTLAIGRSQNAVGNYFNGFIDDIRITRGVARTITVPTAAFPDI